MFFSDRFSSKNPFIRFTSVGSELLFRFTADEEDTNAGFKCVLQFVLPSKTSSEDHKICSPENEFGKRTGLPFTKIPSSSNFGSNEIDSKPDAKESTNSTSSPLEQKTEDNSENTSTPEINDSMDSEILNATIIVPEVNSDESFSGNVDVTNNTINNRTSLNRSEKETLEVNATEPPAQTKIETEGTNKISSKHLNSSDVEQIKITPVINEPKIIEVDESNINGDDVPSMAETTTEDSIDEVPSVEANLTPIAVKTIPEYIAEKHLQAVQSKDNISISLEPTELLLSTQTQPINSGMSTFINKNVPSDPSREITSIHNNFQNSQGDKQFSQNYSTSDISTTQPLVSQITSALEEKQTEDLNTISIALTTPVEVEQSTSALEFEFLINLKASDTETASPIKVNSPYAHVTLMSYSTYPGNKNFFSDSTSVT